MEREGREKKNRIRVIDKASVKKAIEMIKASIAIQDLASGKELKGANIMYLINEYNGSLLERMIIQPKKVNEDLAGG